MTLNKTKLSVSDLRIYMVKLSFSRRIVQENCILLESLVIWPIPRGFRTGNSKNLCMSRRQTLEQNCMLL